MILYEHNVTVLSKFAVDILYLYIFMYIIYLCIYMILDVILCRLTLSNYLLFFFYFISFKLFSWIFRYGSSFFFIVAGHLSLI